MSFLLKNMLKTSVKVVKEKPDFGNPLTVDTTEFFISIGKCIFTVGKEILF